MSSKGLAVAIAAGCMKNLAQSRQVLPSEIPSESTSASNTLSSHRIP